MLGIETWKVLLWVCEIKIVISNSIAFFHFLSLYRCPLIHYFF